MPNLGDAARMLAAAPRTWRGASMRKDYLDLVAKTLDGTIYDDDPLPSNGAGTFDANLREYGWDWPSKAFTMVGTRRLANFRFLIEKVIKRGIPGDIVETGVWRGGACIMARAILKAYGVKDRKVVACDSFEGLPPPNESEFPADKGSNFHEFADLSVSLEKVKENFARFGLLDDQVVFLKGWFRDTMKDVPSRQIAVLRLDGDMYESTIDPLNHLFDRVSSGGYVIVDDYRVVPASKEALHDFLDVRGLKPEINEIDGVGVYFRK